LLSLVGAIMTICRIERNDAEKRVRAMANAGWKATPVKAKIAANTAAPAEADAAEQGEVDLEQVARDSISRLIIQKFKGHGMARLVEAVLQRKALRRTSALRALTKASTVLAAGGSIRLRPAPHLRASEVG
jgi:restriction system protein